MSRIIALIPARSGSKGIPGKNMRALGGVPLLQHAYECAYYAGCDPVAISTDLDALGVDGVVLPPFQVLWRPPELAQDDTPMISVVRHALAQIPGDDDDIWLLVQPTQPFRTPDHLREAVRLLRETRADSVVSVVELPRTHHPAFALDIEGGDEPRLWCHDAGDSNGYHLWFPERRQDVALVYRRDGTVYAFWRRTVTDHGTIYGRDARPLIIPPEQSCELDTEADWQAVEARWRQQHG